MPREREGEGKAADGEIEGASRLKKKQSTKQVWQKKKSEKEKERDPLTYRIYCRVL